MFLHVSGSGMNERIFLQFVPPANVCIWDTFGGISCYTDSGLDKRLKEEACKHLPRAKQIQFESQDLQSYLTVRALARGKGGALRQRYY